MSEEKRPELTWMTRGYGTKAHAFQGKIRESLPSACSTLVIGALRYWKERTTQERCKSCLRALERTSKMMEYGDKGIKDEDDLFGCIKDDALTYDLYRVYQDRIGGMVAQAFDSLIFEISKAADEAERSDEQTARSLIQRLSGLVEPSPGSKYRRMHQKTKSHDTTQGQCQDGEDSHSA